MPERCARATWRALEFISALEKYGEEDGYIFLARHTPARLPRWAAEDVRRDAQAPLSFPMDLANLVRSAAREGVPGGRQSFMLGLLIGDTSGLYDDYELDNALSVSGIRHVVAVSGMHLSFPVRRAGVSAREAAGLGLGRAGDNTVHVHDGLHGLGGARLRHAGAVMLAPLLGREADGLTSLCAGLLILLVANPLSVAAAGLRSHLRP